MRTCGRYENEGGGVPSSSGDEEVATPPPNSGYLEYSTLSNNYRREMEATQILRGCISFHLRPSQKEPPVNMQESECAGKIV